MLKKNKPLIIFGGGDHSLIVISAAKLTGLPIHGILDKKLQKKTVLCGIPVLGNDRWLNDIMIKDFQYHVAISDITIRSRLISKMNTYDSNFINIFHPTANISSDVNIGLGCFIGMGAIINFDSKIYDNIIINTGAVIEHGCIIGSNSHIAPGVVLCKNVNCGKNVFIGSNASISPNISIGDNSIIGAGSVVIKNVLANSTVKGNPAK